MKRNFDPAAPFQTINAAARLTGISAGAIRAGCKAGTVPHIMRGSEYRVNVPRFLETLDAESLARAGLVRVRDGEGAAR